MDDQCIGQLSSSALEINIWGRGREEREWKRKEGEEEGGKGREREWQREQLNGDVVSKQGSADTVGRSGAGMTLQRCPESGQED